MTVRELVYLALAVAFLLGLAYIAGQINALLTLSAAC